MKGKPDRPTRRSVLRAARTVVGWTLLSRLLGLLRDILSAARFGAGAIWDAFTLAWTFPNLFRRLLGEGALASAFIPTLTEVRETEGAEEASRLINAALSLLVLTLVAVAVVCLAILAVVPADAFESLGNVEKLDLILRLLQVLVPYLVLICLTAFLGAVLQTVGHFAAPAAAPVLLNVCWIGALLFLCPRVGDSPEQQILAVAFAILFGGTVQVVACLPPLHRRGIRLRPTLNLRHPALGRVLKLMVPIVIGLAPTQFNILADRLIAEALVPGDGANSALYYGTRMMQFPLALVGVAMATAVLPALSAHAARKDTEGQRKTLSEAIGITAFVAIPAAVGLMVLAWPIVRFLFEHGKFGPDATDQTSRVILGYTVGIPVICVLQVVTRAFYAEGDTKTPVHTAMIAVACNITLNLLLVGPLGAAGLALATSLSATVNLLLLLRVLRTRRGAVVARGLRTQVLRTLFLAGGMGLLVFLVYGLLDRLLTGGGLLLEGVVALVPVIVGVLGYIGGALVAGAPELHWIRTAFASRGSDRETS